MLADILLPKVPEVPDAPVSPEADALYRSLLASYPQAPGFGGQGPQPARGIEARKGVGRARREALARAGKIPWGAVPGGIAFDQFRGPVEPGIGGRPIPWFQHQRQQLIQQAQDEWDRRNRGG